MVSFISGSSQKNILAEQVKDTLGIIKTRTILFPAAIILFIAMKAITSLPISNLVLVFFVYFWISTLLLWYLIKKWGNTPQIIIALDIGKGLFLLEVVLSLFVIYYLSPLFIYLFGSSIWLAFFFYTFYSSAGIGGIAGYSYTRGFINSCFILSCFCCGIVFFWECFGIAPFYKSLPFLTGALYQRSIPSLILFVSLIGVFFAARSFNNQIWEKFRRINQLLEQKTGELEKLTDELEERVEERTQELEKAKTSLEIKVKERTQELEELAKSLDEQVKERTKNLQERLEELEEFYRLTVGRELKMIELEKEIERLQKELEKLKKEQES